MSISQIIGKRKRETDVGDNGIQDKAWEAWGYDTFQDVLTLAPHELLSDDFVKVRYLKANTPLLARANAYPGLT